MISFILLNIEPSREKEIYQKLCCVPEVKEHHPLFGEYDMIAKLEAKDLDALGEIVTDKIRAIDGVMDTKTLPGVEFAD